MKNTVCETDMLQIYLTVLFLLPLSSKKAGSLWLRKKLMFLGCRPVQLQAHAANATE